MLSDDEAMFRDRALADLRHHWSGAYEISEALGVWRAVRLDNQRALVALDPAELRELIAADYAANPVPRQRLRGRPQLDYPRQPRPGLLRVVNRRHTLVEEHHERRHQDEAEPQGLPARRVAGRPVRGRPVRGRGGGGPGRCRGGAGLGMPGWSGSGRGGAGLGVPGWSGSGGSVVRWNAGSRDTVSVCRWEGPRVPGRATGGPLGEQAGAADAVQRVPAPGRRVAGGVHGAGSGR